jgi:TATA-box binding protein (TBP) (component of TFIID and TFIIIB)
MRKKRRANGTEISDTEEAEEEKAHSQQQQQQNDEKECNEPPRKKPRVVRRAKARKSAAATGIDENQDEVLLAHFKSDVKQERKPHCWPEYNPAPGVREQINARVSECETHNVVTKADLAYEFPSMAALAIQLNGVRLKREMEVCVSMYEPRATARIFRTGTLNIVGAKSAEIARLAVYQITRYINERMRLALMPSNIVVSNTMAMMYLNYRLDINRLCREVLQADGRETKKVFGAANVALAGGVALLFASGKIVIFGPRGPDDLVRMRDELLQRLPRFYDGHIDHEKVREEKTLDQKRQKEEKSRVQFMENALKLRQNIVSAQRRSHHRYDKAFTRIVGLESIRISDCLHMVGDLKRLIAANRAKVPFQQPTVAAINSPEKDVCRHRLFVQYKSDQDGKQEPFRPIGIMGSVNILKLFRQNNLPIPDHFLAPPPPVVKRYKVKNPHGAPGEFHRIEGENLRFALAADGKERYRVPKAKSRPAKRPAAAAAAAAH